MNRLEYDNTVRDLLGDTSRPADGFPADGAMSGFSTDAESQAISTLLTSKFMNAAEDVSARAVAMRLATLVPCDPARGDETCARRFIETFGRRAWRRPLAADEVAGMLRPYTVTARDGGFALGIQASLEALLQAPQFHYRIEIGTAMPDGTRRLGPWELASRLSYQLWASTPDEGLLNAAASGALTSKDQLAAQARRMLADPRARPLVQHFSEEWLGLDRLENVEKDTKVVPAWKPAYRDLFREETRRFVEDLVFSAPRPSALALFNATHTFANEELARLYGVTAPRGNNWERITLPTGQRAGVLTQMSVLSTHAKGNQSSPVFRGKLVRTRLLCGELPPPPDDVMAQAPDLKPGLTTRERFAQHAQDPACAGCHRLIDPLGLAFEKYDAMGVWREQEAGRTVISSGEFVATDVDGAVADALDLGSRLARSTMAQECVVKQLFRFSYGRRETPVDDCVLADLRQRFEAGKFDLAALIVDLVQSETFLARQIGGAP